jgi:hypothetical protein
MVYQRNATPATLFSNQFMSRYNSQFGDWLTSRSFLAVPKGARDLRPGDMAICSAVPVSHVMMPFPAKTHITTQNTTSEPVLIWPHLGVEWRKYTCTSISRCSYSLLPPPGFPSLAALFCACPFLITVTALPRLSTRYGFPTFSPLKRPPLSKKTFRGDASCIVTNPKPP